MLVGWMVLLTHCLSAAPASCPPLACGLSGCCSTDLHHGCPPPSQPPLWCSPWVLPVRAGVWHGNTASPCVALKGVAGMGCPGGGGSSLLAQLSPVWGEGGWWVSSKSSSQSGFSKSSTSLFSGRSPCLLVHLGSGKALLPSFSSLALHSRQNRRVLTWGAVLRPMKERLLRVGECSPLQPLHGLPSLPQMFYAISLLMVLVYACEVNWAVRGWRGTQCSSVQV